MDVDWHHQHKAKCDERDNEGIAKRDVEIAIRAGESDDDHLTARVALCLFNGSRQADARALVSVHLT
jgi:hypothetical protein